MLLITRAEREENKRFLGCSRTEILSDLLDLIDLHLNSFKHVVYSTSSQSLNVCQNFSSPHTTPLKMFFSLS